MIRKYVIRLNRNEIDFGYKWISISKGKEKVKRGVMFLTVKVNEEQIKEYFLTPRQRYRAFNDKEDSFVRRNIWTMLLSKDRYRYGICRRLSGTKLSIVMRKNKNNLMTVKRSL